MLNFNDLKKPYLLCIMTKGYEFDNLMKVISDISEIVYKNMSSKTEEPED